MKKRELDDHVIGRTMKTCFVKLIGRPMARMQVRIGMMGDQGMQRDLRRDSQGEEGQ